MGGRVYWVNGGSSGGISYANLDNSGGGDLNLSGSTVEPGGEGILVDSAAGRVYFLNGSNEIGYANVDGSGGGDLSTAGAAVNGPYGIALDPSLGRLYLGNYSNSEEATGAIGFVNLGGGGGGITPATGLVDGPQDPVILKSPIAAGAPAVSGSTTTPASLSCSTGAWASYPGSFVYAEPQSYAYQWTKDGAAIAGATSNSLRATGAGSYACTVTGTNQQGSAAQSSGGFSVTAPSPSPSPAPVVTPKKARFKLVVKTKKVRVKAGKVARIKVKVLNQGELGAKIRVCAKVPKKARRVLKPKCAKLGSVKGLAKKVANVKVKTKPKAKGTYTLKILVKGAPGKPAKAKLQIIG
ncbi:MAG TPA: hypothetical protein VFK14_02250 [Solirubrobacterales bacterium]|nr:hypothetical protein [Solirubrobacterales bacterium]